MRKKVDVLELGTFTFAFYVLAAAVVVFLLCVLPSVVTVVVSP